jgi:hypothetical protein
MSLCNGQLRENATAAQKRAHYLDQGYWVEKRVIPHQLVSSAIDELARMADLARYQSDSVDTHVHWNCDHAVTLNPKLWGLVAQPSLLIAARQVLSDQNLVYAERSQAKIWKHRPMTGGHRDTIEAKFGSGTEWNEYPEPYGVVNVALYLQERGEGFEWGAIPGSHRGEHLMGPWEQRLWRRLHWRGRIGSRLGYVNAEAGWLPLRVKSARWPFQPPAREVWISPRPGDCIFFDPRLIHAGGPVPGWKIAVFFSLGTFNQHTRRHATHFGPDRQLNQEVYAKLKCVLHDAGVNLAI